MRVRLGVAVALFAAVGAVAAGSAFAPVEYKETGETSFEVSVWGRTYRYENSVFPVSVKTAGREIFAAPMSLHAKFGDVEGSSPSGSTRWPRAIRTRRSSLRQRTAQTLW